MLLNMVATTAHQMSAIDVNQSMSILAVLSAFVLTLVAHAISRWFSSKFPIVPAIVIALVLVIGLLFVFQWEYQPYYQVAEPIFSHLLGYVTVMLAIPLASLNFSGLPLKKITRLVLLATSIGVCFPMLLALMLHLSHSTVLAFATRSVTAPIGLNIATLVDAPLTMANLIIMVSGIVGASSARFLFRDIDDDRAKGLALGLAAHAFGTIEAWQISPIAGRYAAFGLAVNGIITAIWFPLAFAIWKSI